MRAVLYTFDLEPITVLELPAEAMRYLRKEGAVNLQVIEPLSFGIHLDPSTPVTLKYVRIVAEPLRRREHETLMLFTADEESALLLKAAFLPGQHSAVRERERRAFAKGVLVAFTKLGE